MAWRCSGTTNLELVQNMARNDIVTSDRVLEAMSKVDRACFVREPRMAYEDSPQPIGYGATISAPHMHAYAVENLLPFLKPGARVLDVGSGSGYLTAVLYHLIQEAEDPRNVEGRVYGIEHVPELVHWSLDNLRKDGLNTAVDEGKIKIVAGDGRKGSPDDGPFDAIHVGAAAPSMPTALVEQLASPGRMFIPVGTQSQQIFQVDKDGGGNVTETPLLNVLYVPLTDRNEQI
ncbi:Pcmt1-prov protein [Lentinus tigrinus ALCF2SS1-7]|uniref:Pcmt1-prov protein n=1 Tax=Lentinus tigrinus ALCF2SS1-7 TaxID=1328758 RepID=UPI001165E8DA|nr:Pcmt1-prov protein [Lentinus tigrinus ALCF2SS1-7]